MQTLLRTTLGRVLVPIGCGLLIGILLVLLTGCGGNGDDTDDPARDPPRPARQDANSAAAAQPNPADWIIAATLDAPADPEEEAASAQPPGTEPRPPGRREGVAIEAAKTLRTDPCSARAPGHTEAASGPQGLAGW